jgi:hypothetical protein
MTLAAAEGWGGFEQTIDTHSMTGRIRLKYGKLKLNTLVLSSSSGSPAGAATAQLEGTFEPVRIVQQFRDYCTVHQPDRRQGRSDSYRACGLVVSDNFTMFDRALAN